MAHANSAKIVRIAAEQLNTCYYCGRDFDTAAWHLVTLDHKTPKCRGGSNRRDNLVACCVGCNTMKGALDEAEFWACFEAAHRRTVETIERRWPGGRWTCRHQIYRCRFVQILGGLIKRRANVLFAELRLNQPPSLRQPRAPRWPARVFDLIGTLAGRGAVVARESGGLEAAGSIPAVPTNSLLGVA